MAIASIGHEQTYVTVCAAITKGMAYFSEAQRLPPAAVSLFAEWAMDKYPHESLADITVFLRSAAMGSYGEKAFNGEIVKKGETYGQLTLTRLGAWFEQYLEEKADALGAARAKESASYKSKLLDVSPAILKVVKSAAEETTEKRKEERLIARMEKLKDHLPRMTDDELRQAYSLHNTADERALIIAEADARGLIQKAMDEALDAETPEVKRSNEPIPEIVEKAAEVTEPLKSPSA